MNVLERRTASTLRSSARPEPWRLVHRAADSQVESWRRAILRAAANARASINEDQLQLGFDSLSMQDCFVAVVPGCLAYEATLRQSLPALIARTYRLGGEAALKAGVNGTRIVVARSVNLGITFRFDVTNPRAVDWIWNYGGNLITQIGNETRAAIRAVIAFAFEDGVAPRDMARQIRPLIGLTTQQALAVRRRYGKMVDKLGAAKALKDAKRYTDRLHRERALTIARTETIAAATAGQEELWNQAVDKGLLTGLERKVWIVTPDDRLCPICSGNEDEIVNLNAEFSLPGPPAHPRCRCAIGLVEPKRGKQ